MHQEENEMNKKHLALSLSALLVFAGCAQTEPSKETDQGTEPEEKYVTVLINTDGLGEVAVKEGGGEVEFDEQYPYSSHTLNVEEGTVLAIDCRGQEDYVFVKWTKDGKPYSKEHRIEVTASEDTEYVAHFDKSTGYEGEPVTDIKDAKKLGDVLGLPYKQSGYGEENYVFVFELNDVIYRAVAEMDEETSSKLWDLDFFDPDHNRQENELVENLPITRIDNITEHIPTEEKLQQYVGKTGQELMDEGWEIYVSNVYSLEFVMQHGAYAYGIQFAGELKDPSNFDDSKDMKDLTVKSIRYYGLGDVTNLDIPLE